MALCSRFSSRVENYLRFKPHYPKKLIDFLYEECGFSWESVIADIGSGMGVFSRLLLERGSRVVGIEPNGEMRSAAERILCDEFPRFVSLGATAENTTLSDASVHHIVCTQSFHGFDLDRSKEEFARILRPGGSLVLICSKQITGGNDFTSEYEALKKRFSKTNNHIIGQYESQQDYHKLFSSGPYMALSIPGQQILDFEGVKGRLLACFDIPNAGEDGYDAMLEELQILFELYSQSGKVTLHYETQAHAGRLSLAG